MYVHIYFGLDQFFCYILMETPKVIQEMDETKQLKPHWISSAFLWHNHTISMSLFILDL